MAPRKDEIRLRKYYANRLSGMNKQDAAIAAGYSKSTARAAKDKIEAGFDFDSWLDGHNLDDNRFCKKLDQLLEAKKIQSCNLLVKKDPDSGEMTVNENSNDFIEVDDNYAQTQALKILGQLLKLIDVREDTPVKHTSFINVIEKYYNIKQQKGKDDGANLTLKREDCPEFNRFLAK
jgi:hypothetical protein